MPTGSLCAERNVIGSALADNLGLRRKDLRAIAVYSAGMLGNGKISRKSSSLCAEPVPTAGSDFDMPLHATHAHSMRQILHKRAESWSEIEFTRNDTHATTSPEASAHTNRESSQLSVGRKSHRTIHSVAVGPFPDVTISNGEIPGGPQQLEVPRKFMDSPIRYVNRARGLCSCTSTDDLSPNLRKASRTINVEEGDMNPLKPCGACLEWLKKIAEVNPEFLIVTFTDANCEGIYVEQVDTAM